jgi:hypothetical protein
MVISQETSILIPPKQILFAQGKYKPAPELNIVKKGGLIVAETNQEVLQERAKVAALEQAIQTAKIEDIPVLKPEAIKNPLSSSDIALAHFDLPLFLQKQIAVKLADQQASPKQIERLVDIFSKINKNNLTSKDVVSLARIRETKFYFDKNSQEKKFYEVSKPGELE